MELTEKQTFNVGIKQKKTLVLLHKKYGINTSEFIRKAISEKMERDKETILKHYKDIQKYIDEFNECPF